MRKVRPLGDWIFIEKIVFTKSLEDKGLIHLPATFDHKHRASLKHMAVGDYFHARVLARGPRVPDEIAQFDEVLVYTYAEGTGERFYTGEDSGERGRMFVKPKDCFLVVDRDTRPLGERAAEILKPLWS